MVTIIKYLEKKSTGISEVQEMLICNTIYRYGRQIK